MKNQVNPKVALNRKKMKQFLESLQIRTHEEIEGRKKFNDAVTSANSDYQTIRNAVSSLFFSRNRVPSRATCGVHTNSSRRSMPKERETKPRYIPASRYALPMQIMGFMPRQEGNNAVRIMQLSRLRPTKPIHSEIDDHPVPDDSLLVPEIVGAPLDGISGNDY